MKEKKYQKYLLFVVSFFIILFIILVLYRSLFFKSRKKLSINEVCSKNVTVFADSAGKYYDYIELFNTSEEIISLKDYGLTDSPDEPFKFQFSDHLILPNNSLVVFATAKGTCPDAIYTGFNLDVDEEFTLYLCNPAGQIIDQLSIPLLKQDITYGRVQDGGHQTNYLSPSPHASNTTASIYVDIEEPVLSLPSGFYESGTNVSLTTNTPSLSIHYTLDCTTPTKNSPIYTNAIVLEDASKQDNVYRKYNNITPNYGSVAPKEPVDKAVILKAVAFDNQGNQSDVVTASYFIDFDVKNNYQDGMILSLTTDPDNLFSDESGIYVTGSEYDTWYKNGQEGEAPPENYLQNGKDSEREAFLEIFDTEHNTIISQNIGIRIQGASTRKNAQKRFSLYSRKEYGTKKFFPYDFFNNNISSHSLILRDKFTDSFCQSFMENRNVSIQHAIPVYVFLEGEYWGHYYLQEKYSDDYLSQYYQVDNDNVIIIKNHSLDTGNAEDYQEYMDFFTYIRDTDMSIPENYEKACELMDMQSYIDFVCAQVYMCNMDWCNYKNIACWRTRDFENSPYGDRKWRFMLYDCDALSWGSSLSKLCGAESAAEIDSFTAKMPYADGSVMTNSIFSSLLKSSEFRQQFITSFYDISENNFSYKIAQNKLHEWGISNSFYDDFFKNRKENILFYLERDFNIVNSNID